MVGDNSNQTNLEVTDPIFTRTALLDVGRVYEEIEEDLPSTNPPFHCYLMIYLAYDAAFYHVLRGRAKKSVFYCFRGETEEEKKKSWQDWRGVFTNLAHALYKTRKDIKRCLDHSKGMERSKELLMAYWDPEEFYSSIKPVEDLINAKSENEIFNLLQKDWIGSSQYTLPEILLTLTPQTLFSKEVAQDLFLKEEKEPFIDFDFIWNRKPDSKVPLGELRFVLERLIFLSEVFGGNRNNLKTLAAAVSIESKSLEQPVEAFAVPISNGGLPEGLIFGFREWDKVKSEKTKEALKSYVGKIQEFSNRAASRIFDAKMHILRDCFQRERLHGENPAVALVRHCHKVIPSMVSFIRSHNGQSSHLIELRSNDTGHETESLKPWFTLSSSETSLQDFSSIEKEFNGEVIKLLGMSSKLCNYFFHSLTLSPNRITN